MEAAQGFLAWLFFCFRPMIKGFLRVTTRLCELQRVCYGERVGAPRTMAVERSLEQTRSAALQEMRENLIEGAKSGDLYSKDDDTFAKEREAIEEAMALVLKVKKIKKELHPQFLMSFRCCLRQICGLARLSAEVESLRAEAFSGDDLSHERGLLELWALLQPGVPLETRRTKQWQSIGFQGDDPKTDFRGMGVLGLQNLLYFAREYSSAAKHILSHSNHPKHGYSFAIVGINLTHMAYKLLADGSAKSHLYNVATAASDIGDGDIRPRLSHFHHLYCYLFVEFDKFWLSEKPANVMEFNRIRDLFENNVRAALADPEACLRINVEVDTV